MKDQPLPLNSAVDLWPWIHFSLGFLTSFGRLSIQECLALSLLYEEKIRIPKNRLRWLEIVSSTCILMGRYNHSLSLDATVMVSKNCPTIGEHVFIIFVTK